MPLRRRVWLSREGWYYVAVLAFIVGGAVLRNVNLLVVLAGMMVAPLVLNWRLVMASLRGLSVQRKLPPQASAGQPLSVELSLTNHRTSFSSWLVRLEDRVELVDDPLPPVLQPQARWFKPWTWRKRASNILHPEAPIAHAPAGETSLTSYRVTFHRRGRYRFGPLRVLTRYPLGLVVGHIRFHQYDELTVVPRLGQLTAQWNELIEADSLGEQRRHPRRGFVEGDYYGLRPWQTGDSPRWIHWRTTAKLNTLTVRQFERQQSHDLAIIVDPWLPESPTVDDVARLEMAISLAATAVADMCQRIGGRLTFAIGGPTPRVWIAPVSPLLSEEILLALAQVVGRTESDWQGLMEELAPALSEVGRALVISPRHKDQAEVTASAGWVHVTEESIDQFLALD